MTREEKLEAIYKEMANTEIELGCKIKTYGETGVIIKYQGNKVYVWWDRGSFEVFDNYQLLSIKYGFGVIGHPVMIGDVLGWLDRKICLLLDQGKEVEKLLKGSDALNLRLINVWKHKIKPLDEQPDYCIDYVINILDKFGSVI